MSFVSPGLVLPLYELCLYWRSLGVLPGRLLLRCRQVGSSLVFPDQLATQMTSVFHSLGTNSTTGSFQTRSRTLLEVGADLKKNQIFFLGGGDFFSYYTIFSTASLPPLRFHCADGCWD